MKGNQVTPNCYPYAPWRVNVSVAWGTRLILYVRFPVGSKPTSKQQRSSIHNRDFFCNSKTCTRSVPCGLRVAVTDNSANMLKAFSVLGFQDVALPVGNVMLPSAHVWISWLQTFYEFMYHLQDVLLGQMLFDISVFRTQCFSDAVNWTL